MRHEVDATTEPASVRNAICYTIRMAQFVARLEDSLAERVDSLVAAGLLKSRSEAVRIGLEQLADRLERQEIGRRIVEGYRRMPQTDEELAWADELARRMIEEEPW